MKNTLLSRRASCMIEHRADFQGAVKVEKRDTTTTTESSRETQPIGLDSATLARLIEEVRNEPVGVGRTYDRVHNRHNR
jgi:hypothetical protein